MNSVPTDTYFFTGKVPVESGWIYYYHRSGYSISGYVTSVFVPDDNAPHVIEYRKKAKIHYELSVIKRISERVGELSGSSFVDINSIYQILEDECSMLEHSLNNDNNDESVKITIK